MGKSEFIFSWLGINFLSSMIQALSIQFSRSFQSAIRQAEYSLQDVRRWNKADASYIGFIAKTSIDNGMMLFVGYIILVSMTTLGFYVFLGVKTLCCMLLLNFIFLLFSAYSSEIKGTILERMKIEFYSK